MDSMVDPEIVTLNCCIMHSQKSATGSGGMHSHSTHKMDGMKVSIFTNMECGQENVLDAQLLSNVCLHMHVPT